MHCIAHLASSTEVAPLPIVCCPKPTFSILEVFVAFFPSLKQNFMQTHLFSGLPFFRYANNANDTLALNKTLLNNHK
jgi:hypothetical protein